MKISVITPSYNQGRFIERTLQSVLSQNIDNLDYWVIDGGSNDDTVKILQKYSDQLRYVSEPDRGQTHAINKGLQLTQGEIIGWLNSDDIYYPDAIKNAVAFFKENPDIDILYGQAYHIDAEDQILHRYYTSPWNFKLLKQRCYVCQPAVFFRRRIFENYGLLNENLNFCMDYEFWIRLGKNHVKFGYLNKILAASRVHSDAKTSSLALPMQKEVMTMLKSHLGYVPLRWFLTYSYVALKNKTSYKLYDPRFCLGLYLTAVSNSFKYNGPSKGILSLAILPGTLIKLLYTKWCELRA